MTNRTDLQIFKTEDLAELFGVHKWTIYRWIKNGTLSLPKIGNRYYAERKYIENLLNERVKRTEG